MSLARKILSNTAVQILGKIVTAIMAIVILKLISTYLGRAGYGNYTTVYEFLAFFGIAADFGIFQIAVKEMSANPEKRGRIFGNILALRCLLVVIAMSVAIAVGFIIPKYAGTPIPKGIAIASLTTLLTILFGTLSSLLQVELKMHWNALGLIASKFIALIYIIYVVKFWFPANPQSGFYQLLVAGIVGGIFQLALAYFAARKIEKIALRFDWDFWKDILRKTLPYGAAILLATIYVRIDVIILSLMKTQEEVGIYGVATRIIENLAIISIFFLNSTLPTITRLYRDNKAKLLRLLQYAFDFLVLLGLPVVIGGITLAYPLIAAVSDPQFLTDSSTGFFGSDIALQILLLAMFFAYFGNLFGYTLLASNNQLKILYVNSFAVLFNTVGNILIIPYLGFRGAAITSVVSQMFVATLGFFFVRRIIHFSPRLLTFAKTLFASLVMGFAVWKLQPIFFDTLGGNKSLLVLIPLGGVIYVSMLLITKTITKEMWGLVLGRR